MPKKQEQSCTLLLLFLFLQHSEQGTTLLLPF